MKRLRNILPLALLVVVSLLSPPLLLAQTSRGTVTGQVTDPKGAVIPGATVELTNKGTNQTRTVTTNDAGIYRFDAVDLGQYDLKISTPGFQHYTATGIEIQANRIATFDAQLQVGTTDLVVEINAGTEEILQKSDAVHGGNFNQNFVKDMPSSSLSAYDLARLVPGVTTRTGTTGFANGTSEFSINGQRPRGNNYLIDGVENNDISIGGPATEVTNRDAIVEATIQTGLFSAEFGRAGGGIYNAITKSGTNSFHGTGFWQINSQVFNALTNGDRLSGLKTPAVFTENNFGFTFGGPIIKDKTFFFGAGQWDRFRSTASFGPFVVPSAAGLATLQSVFPKGSNPRVDLYLASIQGLVGVAGLTQIPLGSGRPSVEFGSIGVPAAQLQNDRQFVTRVDHSFNGNHRLSVRYLIDDTILTPDGVNGPGFLFNLNARSQNLLGTHNWVISPSWTNELRFSYGRINFVFPIAGGNPAANTLPNIAISGISAIGIQTNIPQFRIADNYLVQETMSKIVGTHTFRFGVEFLRQIAQQHPPFIERGAFTILPATGFSALANFIDNFSGSGGSATINFGNPIYHPNLFRQSYFFQDTWKARQNLTLTLGLRYENFGQPANGAFKFPAFAGFDPAQFLVPNQVNPDNNNFGPVVGFAWTPAAKSGLFHKLFGDDKTVWRGGYQISYDSFFNNLLSNIAADSPNTISTTTVATSTGRGQGNFFPSAIPATARVPTPLDSQTSVFSKNIRNPYTQRWSLELQRELPAGMLFDLAYVGTVGHKLFVTEDLNPKINGGPRLFPNIGPRSIRDSAANSAYHSLQLAVNKRFSHGFQIDTSYTWSKFIDQTSEVFATTNTGSSFASIPVSQGGLKLDRGVSDYDRPHRLVIAYIWQLPGPKDSALLRQAFGGWELAGITSFQSGAPYTILQGTDRNGDGRASDRPDIGNPAAPHNTRAVIDTGCSTGYRNPDTKGCVTPNDVFVVQATGAPTSKTIGRNTERAHAVNNFDVDLVKRFVINERFRLEYRLEAFDVFNHPQFTSVPPRTVTSTPAGQFLDFGQTAPLSTAGGGRTMRMGLKLVF
jgi:hypothetical protein